MPAFSLPVTIPGPPRSRSGRGMTSGSQVSIALGLKVRDLGYATGDEIGFGRIVEIGEDVDVAACDGHVADPEVHALQPKIVYAGSMAFPSGC